MRARWAREHPKFCKLELPCVSWKLAASGCCVQMDPNGVSEVLGRIGIKKRIKSLNVSKKTDSGGC